MGSAQQEGRHPTARGSVRRAILAAACILAVLGLPAPVRADAGSVREIAVAKRWTREPVVAADPLHPEILAVVGDRRPGGALDPRPYISRDGGLTWALTPAAPWAATGRWANIHPTVAFGPGPTPGSTRLWWADMLGDPKGVVLGVTWSDDLGRTWARPYIEKRTPPWVGGFPDLAVDTDPASPNLGTVYVAYNWLASSKGPGLHVIASRDGRRWAQVEVPRAPAPAELPESWRIGYRLAPARDGSVYVAAFQADMRDWSTRDIFSRAGTGRLGWSVARLRYDPAAASIAQVGRTVLAVRLTVDRWTTGGALPPGMRNQILVDPGWQAGFVALRDGRLLLAVHDYAATSPRGRILVARSVDSGSTWSTNAIAPLPKRDGRLRSSVRPELAALADGRIWLGWTTLDDRGSGTRAVAGAVRVGAAYAVSFDGGGTFGPARELGSRWDALALSDDTNQLGLRYRATATADGRVWWARGDGRRAGTTRIGLSVAAVYGALIVPPTRDWELARIELVAANRAALERARRLPVEGWSGSALPRLLPR
jgi:hypothetical protein